MSRCTYVTLRLPDGTTTEVGTDALFGRTQACAVRLDDARVSSVHAELSWRAQGFVLLARGGRVLVHGRGVREFILSPGLAFELAPGLVFEVVDVVAGDAPTVPDTEGRERLRFVVGAESVRVTADNHATSVLIGGVGAQVLATLLTRQGGVAWDSVAEAAWPDEGTLRRDAREGRAQGPGRWTDVDERRFRNRWDQQITALRRQLAGFRCGALLVAQRGVVELALQATDTVESPGDAVRASRTPNVNTASDGSDA